MKGVTGQVTAEADPRSVPHESQAKICAVLRVSPIYINNLGGRPTFAPWQEFQRVSGRRAQFLLAPLAMTSSTESLWRATSHLRRFAPLSRDLDVDVAIVGAGITGLTAAVLLGRAGRRVAVLQRDHVGSGETGSTTSHLTEAVDARYRTLVKDFGEEGARLVAKSSRDAIDQIEAIARASKVDC